METQTVEIRSTKTDPNEVVLVVDGVEFGGWKDVRATRGIERMPSDFQVSVTELYPNLNQYLPIRPGQTFELWFGKSQVSAGYIERLVPSFASGTHTVTIAGRGKPGDLVDCMAEWTDDLQAPGGMVKAASVLELARRLAAPFGVDVEGEPGPPIGGQGNLLLPMFVIMIGETAWEIIERLCRIAGLLVYDTPQGNLRLAANPASLAPSSTADRGGYAMGASGFELGVNVKRAQAAFTMDQRFSHYRAYATSFDQWRDISPDGNLRTEVRDLGVGRYRPHATLMEVGKAMALENVVKRAEWEKKRRWGRSNSVTLTTDSWRDVAGNLYAPNTLVPLKLLDLKIETTWLISEVTYRLSGAGTECDVTLMPPEAFNVQPTLPNNPLPLDFARLPDGLGRP